METGVGARLTRTIAAAIFGAVLLASPSHAGATTVTRDEFVRLVDRAATDTAARRELREVTDVDGRPVDLGTVLDGRDADARLRQLAAALRGPATDAPTDAPATARAILRVRAFHPHHKLQPLRGALRALGRVLRPVFQPIGRALDHLFGPVFRRIGDALDSPLGAVAVGAILIALIAAVTNVLGRRRTRGALARARAGRHASREDPAALEARADAAEDAADYETAVRLRFRAGLLRLDDAGALELRPSLTAAAAARAIGTDDLRALARTFDEVAYGGRTPEAADAEYARVRWPQVLAAAAEDDRR